MIIRNFKFNIRQANINDATAIATIGYNAFKDSYENILSNQFMDSLNLQENIKRAEQKLKNDARVLIATNETHWAIGYCAYGPSRSSTPHKENEIYSIYINKTYRSRGLGRILLYEVEDQFAIRKPIIVKTLKANTDARRFYEDNGYLYLPERDGMFRDLAQEITLLKNPR